MRLWFTEDEEEATESRERDELDAFAGRGTSNGRTSSLLTQDVDDISQEGNQTDEERPSDSETTERDPFVEIMSSLLDCCSRKGKGIDVSDRLSARLG